MICKKILHAYELNIQTNGTIGGRSDHEYEYPAPIDSIAKQEPTQQASGDRSFKQRLRAVTILTLLIFTLLILVLIASVTSFVIVFEQLEQIKGIGIEDLTCEELPPPDNGEISVAPAPNSLIMSHGLGSVATYSCDPGYALVGQTTRICVYTNVRTVTTGTSWSGTPPHCQGITDQSIGL